MPCICTEYPPPAPEIGLEVWAPRPGRGLTPTRILAVGSGHRDGQVLVKGISGFALGREWWVSLQLIDTDVAIIYARARCTKPHDPE